uniref:Uncharacterized protein n=1 Tax=Eptatretus burgeri TaxID=7764 RepID=A0A8C4QF19_EPTBU
MGWNYYYYLFYFCLSLQFRALKVKLDHEFPGKLEIVSLVAYFALRYVSFKKFICFCVQNGDGFVDSPEKLQKIFKAVENALKGQ